MTTPTRSVIVVISGPEAAAGSTPTLLKKIGTAVPTKLEITIASKSAIPMQKEIKKA